MLEDAKTTSRPWRKERINPIEYLKAQDNSVPWIEFDPTICKGITPRTLRIGVNGGGDGTRAFVSRDIETVLMHILHGRPFFSGNPPIERGGSDPEKTLARLRYKLGWIRIAMTFPAEGVRLRIDPTRRYPGMRNRVSLCYQPGYYDPRLRDPLRNHTRKSRLFVNRPFPGSRRGLPSDLRPSLRRGAFG